MLSRCALVCVVAAGCTDAPPDATASAIAVEAAGSSASAPVGSASASTSPSPAFASHTTNELFATATVPTFVVGTLGDERTDRAMRIQAGLLQGAFPRGKIVDDTTVVASGWPDKPVVYGGPHVNAAAAALHLPFEIGPGRLSIGGRVLEGTEYRIMTVLPANAEHPELMFYAGTASPGIVEINAIPHATEAITVADRFGPLLTGAWREEGGTLRPVLTEHGRLPWRTVERTVAGGKVAIHFAERVPPAPDEAARVAAIERGVAIAAKALSITGAPPIDLYVYPDQRSQVSFTGHDWSGQAVVEARALHIIQAPPEATEHLVAHESSHVLAYQTWGGTGLTVLGEGLAVFVANGYRGRTLDDWRTSLAGTSLPSLRDLITHPRDYPEGVLYPLGGLLVRALWKELGPEAMRTHLFGATASTWSDACRDAGTTPEALEALFARALAAH